jgi:hypothetical protein
VADPTRTFVVGRELVPAVRPVETGGGFNLSAFWEGGFGGAAVMAPDRAFEVGKESRTFAVAAESAHVFTVVRETRVFLVAAESRVFTA